MFPKSRRDIMLLICIKAAALTLIYYVLVAPTMSPMSRCSGSSSGATCARAASRWNLPNRPGRFRTEIDSRVERGA